MRPKVSIITVTFNAEQHIERAIKSVLLQDYENIEYVIIDGLSTDKTVDILKKYSNRIDYWVSESDSGIYVAMNKAIDIINGEFYVVMGADDILFPGVISEVVSKHLSSHRIDYLVASMWIGDIRLRKGIRPNLGWKGAHAMVNGHSLGMVIRTDVHKKIGMYSTEYSVSADALFIKKIFYSDAIGISSDVIMGRFSTDGISNTKLAEGLCQNFLIQLETETNKKLQIVLFILRLIKNLFKF